LDWYDYAYGLKSICLRYFNGAGADFGIGEDHEPETRLIPLVLQTALRKRETIKIFGTDYPPKILVPKKDILLKRLLKSVKR
jgi:UDP-glucose 4-epimerase